ncbi:hypothetical protein [Brevibacterium sp. 'Marine']|uniref:hypothetical protein n=1 Tax=Brevibacterium sp. 'Marine' TaxID=2725563 RepID=UPI00145E03D2|nr:hypothetical protein [Brevibacterium sp. 'Marine']
MDTSIIVVIAIVVVFAVAVPAMIRKSATDLSRVEIDTVPDNAAVVSAETAIPGHDHSERIQVFHDKPRKVPSVPTPGISQEAEAPKLSLSASSPEFAVIDGHGETHTVTEAAEHAQLNVLPVAVGETSSLSSDHSVGGRVVGVPSVGVGTDTGSGPGTPADNVRLLHPAVHAVFNDSGASAGRSDRQSRPPQAHPPHASGVGRDASANRAGSFSAGRAPQGGGPREDRSRTGHGGHLGEETASTHGHDRQISNPTIGTDEEHAMTEQATTLRESLKSLNTMVRGFSLVFLASVLGVLVSSVLAAFSVVHIALAGVFLGLAVVALFLVRTLNLRKRDTKKKLRRLQETARSRMSAKPAHATEPERSSAPARAGHQDRATRPERVTKSEPTGQPTATARPKTSGAPAAETQTPARTGAKSQTVAVKRQPRTAPAPTSSGTAARIAAAAQGTSAAAKAAQARAAMNRSAEAKKSREEADTGEIPLVRIRKEAGEGHTTRQVLLTGPIPVVKENATTVSDSTSAEATSDSEAESTSHSAVTAASTQTAETKPEPTDTTADSENDAGATSAKSAEKVRAERTGVPVSLGADLVAEPDTDAADRKDADADVHAALNAATRTVDDPFIQRLKSRDGWSPTPLPVPSYVDAPEAEHPVPSASAADASSYETEARSREDIAAEFAEELGYRPELSDSAREDGPLGHGRKAIRTTKAADLGAVNDVLARRRA